MRRREKGSFCVETDDETDRRGEDGDGRGREESVCRRGAEEKRDENNGDDARRDADDDGNVVNGSEFGRREAKTRGEGEDDGA